MMSFISLIILIIVFLIGRIVEKECINRNCSKFVINTIGVTTILVCAFLIWYFMDIGWIGNGSPIYPGQDE